MIEGAAAYRSCCRVQYLSWMGESKPTSQVPVAMVSRPSTVDVGTSYNVSGHRRQCRSPCWNNQALNFPRRPVPSIFFSPSCSCCLVCSVLLVSLSVVLNHFPRHLTGLLISDGISSPWILRVVFDQTLAFPRDQYPGFPWLGAHSGPCDNIFQSVQNPPCLYVGLSCDC